MIVVCTTCQARFKVADEKIGPRGAKVRCSKCQTVFVVHRELGVMPAEPQAAEPPPPRPAAPRPAPGSFDLDLEAEPRKGVRPSGFIANPFARSPAAPPPSDAADPFSMPSAPSDAADPFGSADPFGAPEAAQPGPTDPFGAQDAFASQGGSAFGSVDPFVATVASSGPGLPTSAVTDLSDLLGTGSGGPPPGEPSLGMPAATPPPEPSGILDSGFDFDPGAGGEPDLAAPTPPPARAPAGAPEPDLALAERTPATGMSVHAPVVPMPGFGDFAGVDPFEDQGGMAGPGLGAMDDDAFGAGMELAEPSPPPAPSPSFPAEPPAPAPVSAAPPAAAAAPEQAAVDGLRQRSSRARAIAVNVVSLVALLAVAVAMLAFWRGMRPGSGGLRPAALLGAMKGAPATFEASRLQSGLYERSDAAPVLFVSGLAVSHGREAVPGLRVRVELLREGSVVAQGEVRAGAVPSPEQLHTTRDAAGVAAVLEGLAEKAPPAVKPGDALPFLVAISDYPPDVTGMGMRVIVEPISAAPAVEGSPQP